MYARVLALTIPVLILACGATKAIAQNEMMQQPDQQQMQSYPMSQEDSATMRQGRMMESGKMGGHTHGMSDRLIAPPIVFRIMFAMMDADGDGTISLQEFQAAHERIFNAMDSNKDGKLTLEEMQVFMHGTASYPQGGMLGHDTAPPPPGANER
jgi:hypothetical protein